MEPFYPLHVRACTRCWLVQLPEFVAPEEIFTEYAYFSGVLDVVGRARARYVEMIRERLELGHGRPRRRARVERRLPAPALRRHGHPDPRHRSGRERRARRPRSAACRRSSSSSARDSPSGSSSEGRRASLIVGNNVLAQVPDLNDFVAGVAALLATTGRRRSSSRTCCTCSTSLAVRHDLPRALLVLLARDDRRDLRARMGSTSTTSRSCRRTAARCGCTRSTRAGRTRRRRGGRGAARARGATRASARPSATSASRRTCKESKRALLDLLIGLRREGKQVVGLRRARARATRS